MRLQPVSSVPMLATSNAVAKIRRLSRWRKSRRLYHVISQSFSLHCLMGQSQSSRFEADDDLQIEIDRLERSRTSVSVQGLGQVSDMIVNCAMAALKT